MRLWKRPTDNVVYKKSDCAIGHGHFFSLQENSSYKAKNKENSLLEDDFEKNEQNHVLFLEKIV
jgi:hypothetical protein